MRCKLLRRFARTHLFALALLKGSPDRWARSVRSARPSFRRFDGANQERILRGGALRRPGCIPRCRAISRPESIALIRYWTVRPGRKTDRLRPLLPCHKPSLSHHRGVCRCGDTGDVCRPPRPMSVGLPAFVTEDDLLVIGPDGL